MAKKKELSETDKLAKAIRITIGIIFLLLAIYFCWRVFNPNATIPIGTVLIEATPINP